MKKQILIIGLLIGMLVLSGCIPNVISVSGIVEMSEVRGGEIDHAKTLMLIEGITYEVRGQYLMKENTYVTLKCYRPKKECEVVSMELILGETK